MLLTALRKGQSLAFLCGRVLGAIVIIRSIFRLLVEFLRFTPIVSRLRFSGIAISVALRTIGIVVLFGGVAAGGRTTAIQLQIVEWHGGLIL